MKSNQSILKEISPEYSLEGLKLKLQYFGHLMQRADSLEKPLMVGKTEGRRRGERQKRRRLDGVTDSASMSLSELWVTVKDRGAWRAAVHGVAKGWTRPSERTRQQKSKPPSPSHPPAPDAKVAFSLDELWSLLSVQLSSPQNF